MMRFNQPEFSANTQEPGNFVAFISVSQIKFVILRLVRKFTMLKLSIYKSTYYE